MGEGEREQTGKCRCPTPLKITVIDSEIADGREGLVTCLVLSGSVRHFHIPLQWKLTNHDNFAPTVRYRSFFTTRLFGFLLLTTTNQGPPSFYPRERPEKVGYRLWKVGCNSVRSAYLLFSGVSIRIFLHLLFDFLTFGELGN